VNEELFNRVQRLSEEAAESSLLEAERISARLSGGVPVYADMTAILLVTPRGVEAYDYETRTLTVVSEYKWRTIALVRAVALYPELAELAPIRPADATDCRQCGGSGKLQQVANCGCGACSGTGWLPVSADGKRLPAPGTAE
jgi:hypothetical protein